MPGRQPAEAEEGNGRADRAEREQAEEPVPVAVVVVAGVVAAELVVARVGVVAADAERAGEYLKQQQGAADAGTDEEERFHGGLLRDREPDRRVIRAAGASIAADPFTLADFASGTSAESRIR